MRNIAGSVSGIALAVALSGAAFALEPKSQGNVLYVTGGVGEAEIAEIKAMAPRYPLQLVTADRQGQYVVGAHVTIERAGKAVLESTLEGPYLLAKLEPGRYRIRANFEGRQVEQFVDVGTSARLVTLNW